MSFTTAIFNVRPVAGLAVPCGFGKSGKAFFCSAQRDGKASRFVAGGGFGPRHPEKEV